MESKCIFLGAKARIAPMKGLTIPRLELIAMLISARYADCLMKDLNLHNIAKFYYTDATAPLAWVQRDRQWGVYVWNKVQEIRKLTEINDVITFREK